MFDSSKAGKIENEKVRTILNTLGLAINDLELEALLEEEDKEGNVQKRKTGSPSRSGCNLHQCFSTFVRPRPGKFFFHKTRVRSQQIYS